MASETYLLIDRRRALAHSWLRWTYRLGVGLYGAGLALLLAGCLCFTTAVFLGGLSQQPRFDPQQREIVTDDVPAYMQLANGFGFTSIGCALLGPPALLAGFVLLLIFVYRAWQAIQDGWTTVSPGLAVGLLLVPFVHWYWVFIGLAGLAGEVNAFTRRHGLSAPRASTALGFVVAVLAIVGCFPIFGLGSLLLGLLLLPVYLRSIQRALGGACRAAQATPPESPPLEPLDASAAQHPTALRVAIMVTATLLAIVGMELVITGGFATVVVAHDYLPERRQIEAAEAAVAHLRAERPLPGPLEESLRAHEAAIERWQHESPMRTAMPLALAVFGGGVVLVVFALALALAVRRRSDATLAGPRAIAD